MIWHVKFGSKDSALAPLRGASPLTPPIFSSIRSADNPRASRLSFPAEYKMAFLDRKGRMPQPKLLDYSHVRQSPTDSSNHTNFVS
ncbi:hypothetical protein PGTUg99_037727 [Puccinia graminis f. sp. tritici]|uniref:Uncharacterized protein n=1 Tax=Puccinia graminis f. sp. tritici TaxID=56615 RepID=A0A5B0SNT3_PUCGR|nr:hypothetical protein PGTUg99_037727 [Puccinia graminis f. sp. tritici]